jgi:Transglutaminase-like superfamily
VTPGSLRVTARRLDPQALRAAWWAVGALAHARRALARRELEDIVLAPPPRLPPATERGVQAVLRRRSATCLERSLVLQRWHAAHGKRRDVVIGVNGAPADFRAHAWLEGEPLPPDTQFDELVRLHP